MLFFHECHLLSGDLQGYVWGRTDERVVVPVVNERERQTYYGAVDLVSKRLFIEAHERAGRLVPLLTEVFTSSVPPPSVTHSLGWGGLYGSGELKEYLAQVNEGLTQEEWKIHCVRFDPNDPTQNPIEDAWLQGKTWLRRMSGLCPSFPGTQSPV